MEHSEGGTIISDQYQIAHAPILAFLLPEPELRWDLAGFSLQRQNMLSNVGQLEGNANKRNRSV
jgi:hypothetical protein